MTFALRSITEELLRWVSAGTRRAPPRQVQMMVTPAVVAKAREYFGCPDMQGLELENHFPTCTGELLGSHWEQRLLHDEVPRDPRGKSALW